MEIRGKKYLPEEFCRRMENMLGEEYPQFAAAFEEGRSYGLRVNTYKISCEEFERIVPFPVHRIPWVENGYFYEEGTRPARCPLYQAGLYYLQEPSAMTPASRLPVRPGDLVLDLCAAPGGKATALGAALQGQGLLIANDISTSRARALLRNLELFGIPNIFVTDESPARLAEQFPEFFHKILLDAPCSGEGMFRKDEALARDWSLEKSAKLAALQRELILQAADMLRPGGLLLYSTCTFAPQENEGTVAFLLENRSDMELEEMPGYEGFSRGVPSWGNGDANLEKCIRVFPHKMKGEGHFMALLHKKGCVSFHTEPTASRLSREARRLTEDFLKEISLRSLGGRALDWNRMENRGEKIYYLPPAASSFCGISFLRNGLYLGDLKKNRFEPSQPFACAIEKGGAGSVISLKTDDPRLERYLRGETIPIFPGEASREKGWHLLCVEGFPLGFGKLVGQTLKNKYPAGWRIRD